MDLSELDKLEPRRDERPQLTFSPHPFEAARERVIEYERIKPNETLGAFLQRTGMRDRMGNRPFVVKLNGRRVPQSLWSLTKPKPGTIINVQAVPRGGGSGDKNPIALIAMVVILIFAWWLGPVVFGAGTFGAMALTTGVIVVGGMVVNSMFPPPKPNLTDQNKDGLADSPTYSLAGGSNRARPYEPFPKICGVHRIFPDFAAKPYTEFQGDDQYAYYLYDYGYNDLQLLDHRIGTNSITEFENVTIEESGSNGKISLFPANVDSQPGPDLTLGAVESIRTSAADATALAVDIVGSLYSVTDEGGLGGNAITLEIKYRAVGSVTYLPFVGASTFVSIVNSDRRPLRKTYFVQVPQGQYEVSVRFATADVGVTVRQVQEITWSQLRSYQPDTADYTGRKRVALKIKASGQLNGSLDQFSSLARARCQVYRDQRASSRGAGSGAFGVSSPTLTGGPVTVAGWVRVGAHENWHNYLNHNWVNNGWLLFSDSAGLAYFGVGKALGQFAAVSNASFAVETWVHLVGRYDGATVNLFVNGVKQTNSTAVAGANTDLPQQVTMSAPVHRQDVAYAGVWNSALTDAQIAGLYSNGAIPTANLAAFWPMQEETGTTYFDTSGHGANMVWSTTMARVAGPTWWDQALTSNPGWWFLDSLRGKFVAGRRVSGAGMDDSRIDIAGIKSFVDWCDGEGASFNAVLDSQRTVWDALTAITLLGRGTPSWPTGKLGVVWDKSGQPVTAVFGMSNIIADSFTIDYATEDLADVIVASFINPDLDWQSDLVRVQVPGATEEVRERRVDLFGCTSKVLAGQLANLYAAQNAYRNRKYRWRTDFEGFPCSRGDVVQLSHDLSSLDYSGRLVEGGNTTTLKLPKNVPLFPGGAFVVIVTPAGDFTTHAVAGGTGDTNTLTLLTPLAFDPFADASHPPYDFRWMYGPTATPGRIVKIASFKPIDERTLEIEAIDEDPAYYAAKNGVFTYTPPPSFGGAPVLDDLRLTADGIRVGKGYLVRTHITWDVSGNYSFADVRASINGGPLTVIVNGTRDRSTTLDVEDGSHIDVEVTVYGELGRLDEKATASASKDISFAGLTPPDAPAWFTLDGSTFRWAESLAVDVIGYRIVFHYGSRTNIDDAQALHTGLLTDSPYTPPALPSGLCTFALIAVDAAGLESEPVYIFQELGDPTINNVVAVIDFEALGYPGIITNGTISSTNILANNSTGSFYGDDDAPKYGEDGDSFYGADSFYPIRYETKEFMVATALVGSIMTLDFTIQGEPFRIYYREAGPAPLYGPDADPFYGPDADSFYDAPPDWIDWPGGIEARNTVYQFRVDTGASETQGIIDHFKAIIDAPDIVDFVDGVSIAATSGTRLPLGRTFTAITNVQGTLQFTGTTAVGFSIEDYDAVNGPLVKGRDKDLTAVAAHGDFIVKGY